MSSTVIYYRHVLLRGIFDRSFIFCQNKSRVNLIFRRHVIWLSYVALDAQLFLIQSGWKCIYIGDMPRPVGQILVPFLTANPITKIINLSPKLQDPLSISSSLNGCHIQPDRENTPFRHIKAYKQAVDMPICDYTECSYSLWLRDGIIRQTESTQHSITPEDIFAYLYSYKIKFDACSRYIALAEWRIARKELK